MHQNIEISLLDKEKPTLPPHNDHKDTASTQFIQSQKLKYIELSDSRYQRVTSNFRYTTFMDMYPLSKFINNIPRPLKHQDLPPPYETFNFEEKLDKLDQLWYKQRLDSQSNPSKRVTLFRYLAKVHQGNIIKNVVIFFMQINTNLASLLLLGYIMGVLTSISLSQGIEKEKRKYYAVGFAICNLASIIFENISQYNRTKLGTSFQLSVTELLYKKLNKISFSSIQEIGIGKISKLLTSDIKYLDNAASLFPVLIQTPYSLSLSLYILWTYFGVFSILGFAVQTIILFCVGFTSNQSEPSKHQKNLITDQRIKQTDEFIRNIQLIKLYGWEEAFMDKINKLRNLEVDALKAVFKFDTLSTILTENCTYVCILVMSIVYVYNGGVLSPEKVYISALVLGFSRYWVNSCFQLGLNFLINARSTCQSLEEVMNADETANYEEVDPNKSASNTIALRGVENRDSAGIIFDNYSAYWTKKSDKPCLKDISVSIKKGKLTAVVGKTGSRKTSLLISLLREIPMTTGKLSFDGSLAYVEQEPVLFPLSIRENIIFGKEFDGPFYAQVLQVCCLNEDLRGFNHEDQTIIGERGFTLSNSQKARLSLARAIYSKSDIYLLDDPLSAVDDKIGEYIYDQAICGLLKEKTVILVVHHLKYIQRADKVLVMEDGLIKAQGTFADISTMNLDLSDFYMKGYKSREDEHENDRRIIQEQADPPGKENNSAKLTQEAEEEDSSSINQATYRRYIAESQGYILGFMTIFLYLISQLLLVCFIKEIGHWAQLQNDANAVLTINIDGTIVSAIDNLHYLRLSLILVSGIILCSYVKIRLLIQFLLVTNTNTHKTMLHRISRTLISFFDQTPLSVILNRFLNDLGTLDTDNWPIVHEIIDQILSMTLFISYLCYINPIIAISSLFTIAVFFVLRRFFSRPNTEIQRLNLTTKRSVSSTISSTLNGLLTIRVYRQGSRFIQNFLELNYINIKAYSVYLRNNRLFSLCLQLSVYLLTITGTALFIYMAYLSKIDIGLLGFAFFSLMSIVSEGAWVIRQLLSLEVNMQSAERIQRYCQLSEEAPLDIPEVNRQIIASKNNDNQTWPVHGHISFQNVFLKYSGAENFALKGISFDVQPGSKIAIIDESGARNSSIVHALFRTVEIEDRPGSCIKIDGMDIRSLGLKVLRGGISILPQTPAIFTSTIRKNLDPLKLFLDDKLWDALEQVGLKAYVQSLERGLGTALSIDSPIFSEKQKRLMSLARVILRKSKIIVLDKATESTDLATDALIQEKIDEIFKDCVVLTTINRVSIVANYDRVLVLDKGVVVEYDHPYKLLVRSDGDREVTRQDGVFVNMVRKNRQEVAKEIFDKAYNAYCRRDNN